MSYIVEALRTPIGNGSGMLRHLDAAHLAGPVLRELARRCPSGEIDQIVLGNVRGPGGNIARVAALEAGLAGTPAFTVDQQCGSGLAAIAAADWWLAGGEGYAIAGGVQSVSTEPLTSWPSEDGPRPFTRAPFTPEGFPDPDMGVAADELAARDGISRERQDAYAARSHERAVAAQDAGDFDAEIVAVGGVRVDERPRRGFTVERLTRFRPAFRPDGMVTSGNCCGVNDGAAGVLMVGERTFSASPRPALRVLSIASATCDPALPGWGIVPATRRALGLAGLSVEDLDVLECNEAFAGQVLACLDALGIDERRNCAQGGAIALGHPWAASGAVLVARLFTQLVRQERGRYGLAAMAIGGGQGIAAVVERIPVS